MISVVVATRNRRQLLVRTIDALARQDWPRDQFEIVVVDNGSTDGSAEAVRGLSSHPGFPRLVLLHEARPGKTYAVNAGLAAAAGDLLAFTDDDVQPEPQWLRALSDAMNETGTDFALGRISPLWEEAPPAWVGPALHGVLAVPDNGPVRQQVAAGLNEHLMTLGCNMAVRRRVFDRIGAWRTDLGKETGSLRSGEDHEFFLRMIRAGFRGVYEPTARVAHFVSAGRLQRSYFRGWLYQNGEMVAGLEREFPSTPHRLLGVPRYLWREAAGNGLAFIAAMRPRAARARFAAETRLFWFAGYLKGAWFGRKGMHASGVASRPPQHV